MPWVTPPVKGVNSFLSSAEVNTIGGDLNFLYGDAGWTAVTFTNGWSNYGGGWDSVGYQMVGKMVVLRGSMAGGTLGTATPAFTLPVGYRPTGGKSFAANNAGNLTCGIVISAAGAVSVATGASTAFVALDGIIFLTT